MCGLTLGSDQAKPLLVQGLFGRERCYWALEPHFPRRNGRHKAAPALGECTSRPPPKPAMLCSEAQFIFHSSTNPRCRPRSTQTSNHPSGARHRSLPSPISRPWGRTRLSLCRLKVCLSGNVAFEPHFPYQNDWHKAAPALEEYTNRPPADVVL
jgi:hypothetical protein